MRWLGQILRAARQHPVWCGASLVLAAALLAGAALRLGGADFCLPMEHCHPDEHYLVKPVLKMLRSGDFNPHYFVYPTLLMYLLLGVFALTFLGGVSAGLWGNMGGIKTAPFMLTGRLTTGLLGTATLACVYLAGRRLADRESAAVGALALAVMPLHVSNSHFITTDVPAAAMCALSLVAAAHVATGGRKASYAWLGLLCGMATAAKYNAFLVAINIPLAHFINWRRHTFFNGNLVRACLWVLAGFLIACPYALLDLPRFLDGVATEIAHYKRAHVGHEGEYNRTFYLAFLAWRGFGPVLFACGIYGLWHMLRRFRRAYLVLLVFPVVYLLFLGAYKVRFVRNLMPVLPYLALWIGVGAVAAFRDMRAGWTWLGRRPAWQVALPLLLLSMAWPAARAVDETWALVRPDTRALARQWILDNIPPGTTIYLQSWSVDSLPPGRYRISRDRWLWDYYVATDRLSRKYFAMEKVVPVKYQEVVEAFQHRPVAAFPGRPENPFYCTASPDVVILERDPTRTKVRAPPPP